MRTVISKYNPGDVNDAVLQGTGSGGLLSDGYVSEDPLSAYLEDDETVVFVRSNAKSGVSYDLLDGKGSGRVVPGDGYRAFAVVTDARLLFIVGDTESETVGDYATSIRIGDIELVDADGGLLTDELAVTTRADAVWQFRSKSDLGAVAEYLEAASQAWIRVEGHLDRARERLVDAGRYRADGEYDEAMAAVEAAAEEREAAREREREFAGETGVAAMDERLSRFEERLVDATVETYRGRARHAVDRAERRWRADDYREAHEGFTAARADYRAALELDGVDTHTVETLEGRLDAVDRNLAALERAPVERANKACELAHETDDLAERAAHLERALERYRAAVELDWGREDGRFTGETTDVRERVDTVASQFVDVRRRLATRRADEGDDHRDHGREDQADAAYRTAHRVLTETLPVARELVPDAVEDLTEHRTAVERRLNDLQDGGAAVVSSD